MDWVLERKLAIAWLNEVHFWAQKVDEYNDEVGIEDMIQDADEVLARLDYAGELLEMYKTRRVALQHEVLMLRGELEKLVNRLGPLMPQFKEWFTFSSEGVVSSDWDSDEAD